MTVTGKLTGWEAVDRKLAKLLRLVEPRATEARLKAGAELIAEEARRIVHRRSGQLAESIGVTASPANAAWQGSHVKGGDLVVYVGPKSGGGYPDGFYGHMEEWGTVDTPAHPFMRPAFDNYGEASADLIVSSLRADADRLMRE